jgi:hypothetical protein
VERLTALEMAAVSRATKQKLKTAADSHPVPEKKRLILLNVAPQEKTQPG